MHCMTAQQFIRLFCYQKDGDDSGSEEVVDDADEDGDSECDGGNSIDQTRPIDGKGTLVQVHLERNMFTLL